MSDFHQLPHRKSPRLQGYDYSKAGAYFVTICAAQRRCVFGQIMGENMVFSEVGEVAAACWLSIPDHHPYVDTDLWVIMPNHIHGVLILRDGTPPLGRIIATYKAAVTRIVHRRNLIEGNIWQSRYHDHIIRDEHGLNHIRHYIVNNPAK